jgi:hypothetical protein
MVVSPWLLLTSLSDFIQEQSEKFRVQDRKISVLTETVHNLCAEVQDLKTKQNWELQAEEKITELKQIAIFDSDSGEVLSVEDFQNQKY